jgi:glyoxylase-like metal-dependent hydrolase (beta-lactamase superfamily II)
MVDRYAVPVSTRGPSGATNAYVVGDSDRLLIDPAGRTDALTSACENGVDHVAVTHHHPDHIQGLQQYAAEFDLTVWARAGREQAFESATGVAPDRSYYPGEQLAVAGGVEVLDTPGHAPEHTAFIVDDGILTGDLAVAAGSVVVGAPEGDMRAYLSSLRRLLVRNPDRLYPSHGPIIDDPRGTCERLIRHRLDRETRVLAAVEAGNSELSAIVDAAYQKDISSVVELAQATVLAHLEKLAVEGSITWDGSHARPP